MLLKRLFFITVISILAVSVTSCKKGSEWAVKIDDEKISIDEFYKFYYTQNKMLLNLDKDEIDDLADDPQLAEHPTINKTKFMDYLVSRKLLYRKAVNDEDINKDELNALMELSKLNAAANYYILEKHKDEIEVSDEEAEMFYRNNQDQFKGVPINERVMNGIKQQIFMQKLEAKSSEFIMDLIAESKVNREGFKKHLKELKEDDGKKEDSKDDDDNDSEK